MSLKNAAGEFELKITYNNDQIIINRSLHLTQVDYPPESWPELRQLLLAEEHDRNRIVLLKQKADDQ